MRQFVAILKDSFREAVDGFVIYAMLGLAALAIVIVGSMSFEPVPPEEAFGRVAQRFNSFIPERGQGRTVSGSAVSSEYTVTAVAPEGRGHAFRLTVTAQPTKAAPEVKAEEKVNGEGNAKADDRPEPKDVPGADSFRSAVAQWAGKAGEGVDLGGRGKAGGRRGGRGGFSMPTDATVDEQKAVTTAQMEEFLTSQFDAQAGIPATVKRVTAGVAEPTYAFDVTAGGGSGVRGWPHKVKIFFGTVTINDGATLGRVLYLIEDKVINGLGAGVALLISVILTAFYVPNMVRKGSVDLLISKPIGRTPLLLYKYVGGLTFIFLVSAFTVGGVWLVLGVRSGFWDPTFLVLVPVLTFTFAILYAVSVLVGVVTRSPIVAMLATIGAMFFFWLVGVGKMWAEERRNGGDDSSHWLVTTVDVFNAVLPRYKDLDTITSKLIAEGTLTQAEMRMVGLTSLDYPSWGVTFGMSFAFIAVMLALACWAFNRRDS